MEMTAGTPEKVGTPPPAVEEIVEVPMAADAVMPVQSVSNTDWQDIDLPDLAPGTNTMGTIRLLDLSGSNTSNAPAGTVFGRYHFYSHGSLKKSITVSKPTLPSALADKIAARGESYVFVRETDHDYASHTLVVFKNTASWHFDVVYDWYETYVGTITFSLPTAYWHINISNRSISGMEYPSGAMSWYDAELGYSMSFFAYSSDRDYRNDQSETTFTLPDKYIRQILSGIP